MMNREEILANSRMENENRDPYEIQIGDTAGKVGASIVLILAGIINAVQIISGNGSNLTALLMLFTFNASYWLYKAIKLKGKTNILVGITWTLCVLIIIVPAFMQAMGR